MQTDQPASVAPVLRLDGVVKTFGAVRALDEVNLEVQENEIHGLAGGNGAGKTTLMNVLFGLYRPDAGEIYIRGEKAQINSPRDAINLGVGMVHQHFLQIDSFTVTENIVLGTELHNRPQLSLTVAKARIDHLSRRFGLEVEPNARIETLPMGARQRVEILKALYRDAKILILDEPTTNLTPQEVDSLFESLRKMVAEGMSVVFITHKLREVMAVCDTVSVLRNGRRVFTQARSQVSEELIVKSMVGSDVAIEESVLFSTEPVVEIVRPVGTETALQVEQVSMTSAGSVPLLDNVSLRVGGGEILGVAGVAGNGQQELAEAILGIRPVNSGRILLGDMDISGQPTSKILAMGVAYVPEDRLHDGFLPTATVAHNLILGSQRRSPFSKWGFLNWNVIFSTGRQQIDEYNIQTQGPKATAANLSGGNIQRVMLARAFSTAERLLVLHNPTSGLDIPSVEGIYNRILAERERGLGALLLSDDLDELLLLCDRMVVMFSGKIVGELDRGQFDKYEIGRLMSGATENG